VKSSNLTEYNINDLIDFQNGLEKDHPCEVAVQDYIKYFLNITQTLPLIRYKEFMYSGKNLNDVGDYKGCKRTDSNYFIIRTTGRYFFQIGICLPKECDLNYVSNARNNLIAFIDKQFNVTAKNDTLYILIPEEKLAEVQKENLTAMIVMLSLTGVFIGLIIMSQCIKSFINNKKIKKDKRDKILLEDAIAEKENTEKLLKKDTKDNDSAAAEVSVSTENKEGIEGKEGQEKRKSLLNSDDLSKITTKKKNSLIVTLIHCFNVYDNIEKIFGKNTNNDLVVLDGVKFFSAFWVVIAHAMSFVITTGIKNTSDFMSIIKNPMGAFTMAGFYSVDSFFFMSGFLLIITLQREKKANFVNSFIFRLIRLYPFYIYVIFASMYFMPFLVDGPSVEPPIDYTKYCAKYWWHNLLFINNLYSYKEPNNCAGHTWYLANDMQFFIIAIFVYFMFYKKSQKVGNIIFLCLFWISNIIQFIIIYIDDISHMNLKDVSASVEKTNEVFNENGNNNIWFYRYYQVPWCRITTYIIGVYFAQLYLNLKDNFEEDENGHSVILKEEIQKDEKKIDFLTRINLFLINSKFSWLITYLSFIFLLGSTALFYPYNNYIEFWGKVSNTLFIIFGKVFFVLGLGILLHSTYLGKFRTIKNILSFHIWTPLSRLSYGIYLLHIYIILIIYNSYSSAIFITFLDQYTLSAAFIVITSVASLVFSLMLDAPMIGIMKATIRKPPSKPKALITEEMAVKTVKQEDKV